VILAAHLIISAYGFWLPNDPRGSWSDFVGSWELFLAGGPATKVTTRRSVAHVPHDRAVRLRAKEALRFPPVVFNGVQAREIGAGFKSAIEKSGYVVYACTILPTHAHLVVRAHPTPFAQIIGHLKREGSMALYRAGLHPFHGQIRPGGEAVSCWAEKGWSVFLSSPKAIASAIRYVERNPDKERKPRQTWSFVTPHSPRPDEQAG
jgi:hypothetical protein